MLECLKFTATTIEINKFNLEFVLKALAQTFPQEHQKREETTLSLAHVLFYRTMIDCCDIILSNQTPTIRNDFQLQMRSSTVEILVKIVRSDHFRSND